MILSGLKYSFISDMHIKSYPFNPDRVLNPVRDWIFIILLPFFIFGCKEDEPEKLPPSIFLEKQSGTIHSDTTVGVNTQMNFAISAKAGNTNLTNLIVLVTASGNSQHFLDTSMNIPAFSITKKFIKGLESSETWTFIIRDKNRLSDSVSINIYRDSTVGFNPIKHITALTMSAQNNPEPGSFYSFAADQVYPLDEAAQQQELIDLVYYFGEDQLTMASPGANIETGIFEGALLNWTVQRTTRFIELAIPPEVFDACENDSLLIASWNDASGKRKAKFLSLGKMFSFKTTDFKTGIFRVTSIQGTDAGTVNIEIKVQE
jgi:hypothetical protein